MVHEFRRGVGSIILLSLILFFNLTARTIFSPLLPSIELDLGISHAQGGIFFLLISLGYCMTMVLSGYVSRKLGHRRTILISSFGAAGALVVLAALPSAALIRPALLLLGMSIGLYFPSGVASAAALVEPAHLGRAMAIHELGPNLGFVAAPLLAEFLLRITDWRGVLIWISAGGLLISLLFLVRGQGGRFPGTAPNLSNVRGIIRQRAFWIITGLSAMAAATTLGVYSMLPVYLIVEKGYPALLANGTIGASRLAGLVMVFLVGFLVDRWGARNLMMVIGGLVALLTILLGLIPGRGLLAAVFLQPMLIGSFFPASIAALSRLTTREAQNLVVSLMVPLVFLVGGGVAPVVLGAMGETIGFGAGFVLLGLVFLVSLPFLFLVPANPLPSPAGPGGPRVDTLDRDGGEET